MERNYKLYVHIVPNGKRYYGITNQTPNGRWRNGEGYKNQVFYRAISKYGWDNIEHIVIYNDLTEDEAKELEQRFIQWYDTANPNYGYNISLGGDGSNHSEETKKKISEANKGKRHTEETKKKLSESHKGKVSPRKGVKLSEETKQKLSKVHKGKKTSEEQKQKISNTLKGRQVSEETRQKMSEATKGGKNPMYGKHLSEEHKQKISEFHKGKKTSEDTKRKMSEAKKGTCDGDKNPRARKVIRIDTNEVFGCIKDAAESVNGNHKSLGVALKRGTKYKGIEFRYYE